LTSRPPGRPKDAAPSGGGARRALREDPAAGYSGTPLAAKLGLKAAQRTLIVDAPSEVEATLAPALAATTRLKRLGAFDFALAFVMSKAALAKTLDRLVPKLDDAGMLWIAWPKKASGVATDMTEDAVRADALPRGLVDVKVCAVDATWSGLKLVRRTEHRTRPPGRPKDAWPPGGRRAKRASGGSTGG